MRDAPETRRSLLVRLQQNHEPSWAEFVSIYQPAIYRSESSSSSSSSTSASEGASSRSSSSRQSVVSKSGTTKYSIGYAVTPWTNQVGRPIDVLCIAQDDKRAEIKFEREPKRCAIRVADAGGATKHTITLEPGGLLKADGKEFRLECSHVAVRAKQDSILLTFDGKPFLDLKE